jgi:hypothetical protein
MRPTPLSNNSHTQITKIMTTFNVNQTTDNGKGDTAGTLSYAILLANSMVGRKIVARSTLSIGISAQRLFH